MVKPRRHGSACRRVALQHDAGAAPARTLLPGITAVRHSAENRGNCGPPDGAFPGAGIRPGAMTSASRVGCMAVSPQWPAPDGPAVPAPSPPQIIN